MKKIKVVTKIIDGIPLTKNSDVNVFIENDEIIINEVKLGVFKSKILSTFKLKLDKVLEVVVAEETELVNMNKSVIGRGAVGMLFGPVGALLGGMSAVGAKSKKRVKEKLMVISYIGNNNEVKNITFEIENGIVESLAKSFVIQVKSLIKPVNQVIEL
ncbi:MAG: hypothetical protein ACRC30_11170 [Clostridium sp.]